MLNININSRQSSYLLPKNNVYIYLHSLKNDSVRWIRKSLTNGLESSIKNFDVKANGGHFQVF